MKIKNSAFSLSTFIYNKVCRILQAISRKKARTSTKYTSNVQKQDKVAQEKETKRSTTRTKQTCYVLLKFSVLFWTGKAEVRSSSCPGTCRRTAADGPGRLARAARPRGRAREPAPARRHVSAQRASCRASSDTPAPRAARRHPGAQLGQTYLPSKPSTSPWRLIMCYALT